MSEPLRGECLCGTVRFTVASPYAWFTHCHCSLCRKHHGSLFNSGFGVEHARFAWLAGASSIARFRTSDAFERPFCGTCGSTVPAGSQLGEKLHVPAGLMRDDPGARPRTHIFVDSKVASVALADGLPQYSAYPPGIEQPKVDTNARALPDAPVAGSCLCGGIAYTSDTAPRRIVNCYCSLCRRSRAAAFASTLMTPLAAFRWTRGAELVRSYSLAAPHTYTTNFCSRCGSLVPTLGESAKLALLPAGGIDTPLPPLPMTHVYVASRPPWYEIRDTWPQFAELPPPDRRDELLL